MTNGRRRLATITLALVSVAPVISAVQQEAERPMDPRHIDAGFKIPNEGYCDQPYVVVNEDGSWTCTLTTGRNHEGSPGQHFVATISKDRGKTWAPLIDIEPANGPQASYGVPLVVPSGKIYAFYTYNGDRIRTLPGSSRTIRADMLGWYCYKYSDDGGNTWSKRYRIPVRATACDRANQWKGEVRIFWGIDKPKVIGDGVYFAFTKLGKYLLDNGEGWLLHSDNILTEADPDKINWRLLPDGEHGLRTPEFGSVQEEFNLVPLGGERLFMVYRTTRGYPCQAYSADGGKTWEKPTPMVYAPGGRTFRTPRACPKLWRCKNGKYLFWFHNHGGKTFHGRNPAWISGGVVRDGKMYWSEPEILLYHNNPKERGMSYPDLIEQNGKYWVTETQKTIARVHEIDPTLLEGLWSQGHVKKVTTKGLLLTAGKKEVEAGSVALPALDLAKTAGMTLDFWIELQDTAPGQVIADSRDGDGRGFLIQTAKNGTIAIQLNDGMNTTAWDCDAGLIKPGRKHHVAIVVDNGPRIISFIVDGAFCDGNGNRQFGWHRYKSPLGDVSGSGTLKLADCLNELRVYGRYLRTSEVVGNFNAGM